MDAAQGTRRVRPAVPAVAAGDDGKVMCVSQGCGSGPNTGKDLRAAARIGGQFSDAYLVAGDDGAIFGHLGGTWKHLNGDGTTKNLNGMSFAGNSRSGWIVGDDGLILKTTDGGDSWGEQNSHTSYNLKGVSAVDADTAWAAGDSGEVLVTRDGGAHWIHSASAQYDSASLGLKAISAINGNRATAVGDEARVITTLDGGASWAFQPGLGSLLTVEELRGVAR